MTLHRRLWEEPKDAVACLCGWTEPAISADESWEKLRRHFESVGYRFGNDED